jgi:hypothetical protein
VSCLEGNYAHFLFFPKTFTVMEGMNILPAGIVFETYKILSEGSELILVEIVPYRLQIFAV